jgi:hypothetical protein
MKEKQLEKNAYLFKPYSSFAFIYSSPDYDINEEVREVYETTGKIKCVFYELVYNGIENIYKGLINVNTPLYHSQMRSLFPNFKFICKSYEVDMDYYITCCLINNFTADDMCAYNYVGSEYINHVEDMLVEGPFIVGYSNERILQFRNDAKQRETEVYHDRLEIYNALVSTDWKSSHDVEYEYSSGIKAYRNVRNETERDQYLRELKAKCLQYEMYYKMQHDWC